jgi:diguanylate cyclase (GGDEF)-like protein
MPGSARFRLISPRDTLLAIGLITAAVVIFQQPLHFIWNIAEDMQARYQVDLIPALTILVAVFAFHQYTKRHETKSHALAAAAEVAQARRRSDELERLMALSQALANSLDRATLLVVLWRYLPTFAREREFWALMRSGGHWVPLVQGATTFNSRGIEALELISERTMALQGGVDGSTEGIADDDDVCFPLIAAGTLVGVLGVRNRPELSAADRRGVAAAAAVVAIGVRNVQLLLDTRELSLRDSLTGCFNRGHAVEQLGNELRRARRSHQPLSIVMFDIDHFKTVNDRLGHIRGDEVLQAVGTLLARVLRSSDIRCRYGGDEFLIILPDTPSSGAEMVAESLRREISLITATAGEHTVAITASLGVTTATQSESIVTHFIDRADGALYEAKRLGRNRFCVSPVGATPGRTATIFTLPPPKEPKAIPQNG